MTGVFLVKLSCIQVTYHSPIRAPCSSHYRVEYELIPVKRFYQFISFCWWLVSVTVKIIRGLFLHGVICSTGWCTLDNVTLKPYKLNCTPCAVFKLNKCRIACAASAKLCMPRIATTRNLRAKHAQKSWNDPQK